MLALPPGRRGLPLLGETLALLRNPYEFLTLRRARHGAVFRSRILGRDVAFLHGPEGVAAFLDPENVTRERGHPAHVRALFGGVNINMFDGPRHRALKSIMLSSVEPQALEAYLPALEQLVGETLSGWVDRGEQALQDPLRRLAMEAICLNILGLSPGPETDAIRADYVALAPGFLAPPIRLPGTTYSSALRAKDRVLARWRALIAERRARPREDGLSFALAARSEDGTAISDDEMALELNHMIVAGYIVFALLAELLLELYRQPELCERARREADLAPAPSTLASLAELHEIGRLVEEAKRMAPILPLVFGTAKRSFEHAGCRIPEGWGVFLALSLSNRDPDVFTDPDRFDPDRYAEPRCEHARHAYAFVPQGGGPRTGHRCLGVEYSTLLAQVFVIALLRGYTWEMPPQDLDYRWNQLPAELKGGLRVTVRRR